MARGVEFGVVVAVRVGMREEVTRGVVAVVGGEGGGVAWEECGRAVMGAGGAFDPDEVTAGVGDEEEALWGGAQVELGEVLAGAGGGAGGEGGGWGGGEAAEVSCEEVGGGGEWGWRE